MTGTSEGIVLNFVNGQIIRNNGTTYTAGGTYSGSDGHDMPVILDTAENTSSGGGGLAMYIDWVKVYTQ
jgi:hypothetical protein